MIRDITVQNILKAHKKAPLTLVDVRSPKEFKEATIPGSINIPIFSDEERAEVGTLYKQKGPDIAKQRGLELFSAKLPQFIADFKVINTDITVFCWRGGMRSKTAATVLDLMGIQASRLSGGYRAYRKWIVNWINNEPFHPNFYVLNGYTGSGKTAILKALQEQGEPVIDLERMAGHRGSIFGQIGLEPSNQKTFDALLFNDMVRYQNASHVFIEGESKRIGKVMLPDSLYKKKEEGKQVFIKLPIQERVNNILSDYHPWDDADAFKEAFKLIKKHIHTPIAKDIEDHLKNKQFHEAVKLLLIHYYDPRYDHAIRQNKNIHSIIIEAKTTAEAVDKVTELIHQKHF
ncbi:tRNA 2-selenouridine(34) synthase MnmH [Lentibacillus saliphilus]|uniref:tRNA 2-selenouridine(34) synthase MnmH n=1 Tax=Lentibacillus saliphilus TaxID=2737028 RepID=UPI001C2FC723|nr:tRNA 2-selenouridine(34) synthase MnmH [Lentibacillus saliphilus]